MKYLKVWTDFANAMEPLKDAERGRLFTGMLDYAERGAEPELVGNERFIWPTVKAEIDRQKDAYQHQCEVNKANVTNRYESLRTVTNRNESLQIVTREDKDKEKTKTEDKDINNTVLLTQNSSAAADYRGVVEAYNEICSPALPQVKQLSDDRKKHIKTGCSRLAKAGLSWRDYFSLVADSDFLMGRDGRWPNCGFDWLIGPKNMLKVLEGNYANRLPAERAQTEEKEAAIRAWEERHQ